MMTIAKFEQGHAERQVINGGRECLADCELLRRSRGWLHKGSDGSCRFVVYSDWSRTPEVRKQDVAPSVNQHIVDAEGAMDESRSMNCRKTVRHALGKRDKLSDAARWPFSICDGLNDLGKRPCVGCTCEDREPFTIPLAKNRLPAGYAGDESRPANDGSGASRLVHRVLSAALASVRAETTLCAEGYGAEPHSPRSWARRPEAAQLRMTRSASVELRLKGDRAGAALSYDSRAT